MRAPSWRHSLRIKIIAWSFVPTVIILSLVALFVYQTYQGVIESQVFERDRQLTGLRAEQMAAQLGQLTETLKAIAAAPDIYRFEPAAQQIALGWSLNRLRIFDGGVVIAGADGRVVAADPRRPDAEDAAWPGMSAVAQLVAGHGQLAYSGVFDDRPGGASVAVSVPIADEAQRYRGMLVGILRVNGDATGELHKLVLGAPAGAPGTFYVVDNQGRLVYHNDPARLGTDVSRYAAVREAMAGRSGTLHTTGLRGQEILASYAPLPDTSWSLVVEEDWGALAASYQGYERGLLALLVLALVVPAAVVAFGVRRITRPVADLTQAAQAVASGRLGTPIAVHTGDELETMADQFNQMSAQLKESYAQLERRVAARTRELSTLNAIAALVSRSLDVDEIISTALVETAEALSVEAGLAYRAVEDEQELALVAQRGLPANAGARLVRLPWRSSPGAGRAGPQLMAVEDWPAGELREQASALGWRRAISLPLAAQRQPLGLLLLALAPERQLSIEELSMLAAIGQQTGVALENARLYRQAEQSAVATERNRLARELHDSVTQTLFAASLIAGVLPTLWQRNPEGGQRRLEELRMLTQGALAEMRTLLLELRPAKLTETPLGDLLRQLAEAATVRARVPIEVEVRGQAKLPDDVQLAFYRITQEALNNMAKYAGASRATVSLGCEGGVALTVTDDGCGFDPAAVAGNHLGLGIMHERAAAVGAELDVDSRPGGGTTVRLIWRHDGMPAGSQQTT